jgi:heme oxygenase (biliverdin-producing, ferredoxin)
VHAIVERTGIMRRLLRGELPLERYRALLRNLYDIYLALEAALVKHAHHPSLERVVIPALFRSTALAADLDQLDGGDWRDLLAEPATGRYVARLEQIEQEDPALLVAHAYVRYLGDLNGGQILKGIVAPMLPPPSGAALSFYEFGSPDDVRDYRRTFSDGLRKTPLADDVIQRIVLEAHLAFDFHRELFEELDTH